MAETRRDTLSIAGVAIGARVRAHFYVPGQCHKMWKHMMVMVMMVMMNDDDRGSFHGSR